MKKIIETDNCSTCHKWITNKIDAGLIESNNFKDIHFSDDKLLNDWCMKNLSKSDIAKLRATIRQAKAVKKNFTKQITISHECHSALKALSEKYNKTFSAIILSKIQAEWDAIDLKPEEIEAAETMAAQSKPAEPANSPIIATDEISLPVSLAEYNSMVDKLKHSPEWNTEENDDRRNVTRILKANGVVFPDGSKISQRKLNTYLKTLS